jgi:Yip1 domain
MNLQTRVVNILTKPASEWPVIAAEPSDVSGLYKNYIVLLAAIPAVCTFLGLTVIGVPFFGSYGFSAALVAGIMSYVSTLASVYIAALIIEKLAPNFDSHGDTAQALKLVAYASTPVWIAGVLHLVPLLGILTILAVLYAIYLFYLGVGPVMKTPQDKVLPYMVVSAIVVVVVSICLQFLLTTLSGAALLGGAMAGSRAY